MPTAYLEGQISAALECIKIMNARMLMQPQTEAVAANGEFHL